MSAVVIVCSKCIRTLIYEGICLIELRAEEGSISHWLEHVLPDDVARMRRDMQVTKKKNVKKKECARKQQGGSTCLACT